MTRPSRAPLALAIASLLHTGLALAGPATVDLYVFDGATAIADVSVSIDGGAPQAAAANGGMRLSLSPGEHQIEVRRGDATVMQFPLAPRDDEQLQIAAALHPGRAPIYRQVSSISGESTVDLASLAAPSAPGGTSPSAVAATVSSLATAADAADAASNARRRAAETLEGVTVEAAAATDEGGQFEATEERRESAQVTETLSSEQIRRAGDSDVGGALKRVTGLTLVSGKYVYVRGLGERYSSVLLNGAPIPSPDPTRRVVPLDLIPTDLLSGVSVQKAYSAQMPGEFGGGTLQLRTRGVPDAPMFRIAGTLGLAEGTSFSDGYRYDGGNQDWLGRDDGSRDLPDALQALRQGGVFMRPQSPANPNGFTPQQLEAVGEQISGVYDVERKRIGPNGDLSLAGGHAWEFNDDWRFGLLASGRYANNSDSYEETRRYFGASSEGLDLRDQTELAGTRSEIDLSGFATATLEHSSGHALRAVSTLIRQTSDEARITRGRQDNQDIEAYKLEWVENSLRANQLIGEHPLDALTRGARLDWNLTDAQARRYVPDTREYRFDLFGTERIFNDRHSMTWSDLDDDSRSWDAVFTLPWNVGDVFAEAALGAGKLDRTRASDIRRYAFQLRGTPADVLRQPSLEDIFSDANIGSNGLQLSEITTPTDTYNAEQSLDHLALTLDLNFYDKLRLNLGLRQEDNSQFVSTYSIVNPNAPPVLAGIDKKDRLPALSATWWIADQQQLRFGYSETLSRPDFRELSPSPFLDPVLDVLTFGNPELRPTDINNFDLRWEYYFSPLESFSVGLFRKEFTNPIEKQLLPGSGSLLLTLANARSAVNQGIEFDVYKELGFIGDWAADNAFAQRLGLDQPTWEDWFASANYSRIDSEIELDPASSGINTNLQRPLEGQSPYAVNFSAGYRHPEGKREATLLYNVSGKRIAQVGVDTQPDVYEQPAGQLDFSWREDLGRGWALKLRLRNLLDPRIEYRQVEDAVTREYRKGRAAMLTLEWSPQE